MTARALGGIVRSNVSDRKVHDFRTCDLAVPVPAIFTGGGNRQRRRIFGAVGASRRNFIPSPRDLDTWDKIDVTVTPNVEANPFDGLSTVDQAVFAAVANARLTLNIPDITIANDDVLRISFDCWSASATTLNVSPLSLPSFSEYYWEDTIPIRAGWGRYTVTMLVSGLSTDTGLRMYLITRDSVARTLKFDRIDLRQNDDTIRWYIEGTTTDYPRRTLNGNGTTPQYGDGGWWATDGTGDLLPSNVIGPSGHPMSKLARRSASDGCYAYQSGMTFVAGEKYARRVVTQAGDDAGDVVFVEMATNPGNYIANGTINVRTGAVVAVNSGAIMLVGRIGKQFIFEMSGTAPSSVTTGYCSWIVPFAGALGTGHYFGCDQTEHGEVCTAHMHSGLGQYGSAVTPPFGELVDVDADLPRVEYGIDGFGRGIRVEAAAQNLLNKSESEINNGSVWSHYELGPSPNDKTTAPDGTYSSMKFVSVNASTDIAHQCYQLGQVIAAPAIYSGSIHIKPSEIEWVVANLYDSTGDHRAWFHLPTLTVGQTPAGFTPFIERAAFGHVRIGLQGTLAASVNAGFSTELTTGDGLAVSTIPTNHGAYYWGANFGPGPYGAYIPGNSPSSVPAAEALRFTDMDGFGLNQDSWTIIVEATEPAADGSNYPAVLRIDGAGGAVVMINKKPDGQINLMIYDGTTVFDRDIAAGTPGQLRRYAIGYDRATQTMRTAATGVTVASTSGAGLATLPALETARIASANGFWWCNNTTAKVEVFKRLLLAEECEREVQL